MADEAEKQLEEPAATDAADATEATDDVAADETADAVVVSSESQALTDEPAQDPAATAGEDGGEEGGAVVSGEEGGDATAAPSAPPLPLSGQEELGEEEHEKPSEGGSLPAHVSRKSEAEKLQHLHEVNRLQEEYEREEAIHKAEAAGHAFFLKEEHLDEGGDGVYIADEEQGTEPRSRTSFKAAVTPAGGHWKLEAPLPPKVREACEKLRENRTGQVLNLGNGGSNRRPVRAKIDKPDDSDLTSTAELLAKSRRSLNKSPGDQETGDVVPINDVWAGAIAEALADNHSVKSLWLQNNEITDKGAHKLIDGIKAHHITCVRVHGRERGPEEWLQHIYFSKNPMTDEAREAIMAAMLWMPPPPKPEMLDEEVMSSIKSSIKSSVTEAGEPEDKNEMCCCGYLPPICGFSCCCPLEEEHKNEA
mmetsp:Transcript_14158/g.32915  ORF Transcript_14158/g.32915 Transcript_14158/m.32915 type:complete len:421 (+) Transcript_14158:107-1369(+)|eukprot:CAMPEP_0182564476 /NCGR_PEP_ID=MMETSP1324-20130603/6418_1 /TAXON_ID=236786 /ORGANISM="Florenciella sp., Strain RCC1587" /LENGTH=420 /DNA_ID=CAMNT_0024777949 /DNA_START=42 /DNA_END=1304 /DNA_ORIENTATION=+